MPPGPTVLALGLCRNFPNSKARRFRVNASLRCPRPLSHSSASWALVAVGGGGPPGHRSQFWVKQGSLLEETRNSRLSPWGCWLAQGRRKQAAVTTFRAEWTGSTHGCLWAASWQRAGCSRVPGDGGEGSPMCTGQSNPREAILTLKEVFLTT